MNIVCLLGLLLILLGTQAGNAQAPDTTRPRIRVDTLQKVDSPFVRNLSKVDSVMKHHSPSKAAARSAMVPGLGQIYNKRYWKLPIVYGALGVTAGIFIHNLKQYKELRNAYAARFTATQPRPTLGGRLFLPPDSTAYNLLPRIYKQLDVNAIRTYRDEFRANIDYSALFFLLFWGLQVVDAAVDAHLKAFDVSPDLSLYFKFGNSQIAGTTGVSLILAFK